ncbi:RNA polymerase sigma-70 factor [Sinomicrobium kalidii]|uniref:RNA polymerase sigma-70 factor n=1 Tax=Sinomicrobium kalidii TaxID=2900738 RepID=UPI001E5D5B47|nr:RNA polymerase sigma-70 factor [Sinomicrobium kalidii]UGU16451.1 RNA polymerase sigma-70 factor [Sinomicrobium kalidii]
MKRKHRDTEEHVLLLLIRQHDDQDAFRELFYRYQDRVFRYAMRILPVREICEEILQDTFVKVWNYRHGIDRQRDFSPLLFRIAKNTVLNYLKSQKTHQQLSRDTIAVLVSHICPEDDMIWTQYTQIMEEAIATLPERCRIIFEKSRFEGATYEEIAEELGIAKSTVRLQIVKSLKLLRNYLRLHPELDVISILILIFLPWI